MTQAQVKRFSENVLVLVKMDVDRRAGNHDLVTAAR
jgi:hypothetical protein